MDENNKNPFEEKEATEETVVDENKENETVEEIETSEESVEINQKDEYQEKYEDLNNKYIRLAADFDNFRKRTLQEKEELSKYTTVQILKKITVVLDTFDRAQEQLKEIEDCKSIKEGYEIAYKQLLDTLNSIGMKKIEAMGQVFNPNEHEAITQVPTDEFEPDTIAFVAQSGYKFEDKVVRPAMVGVAVKKENE